MENAQQIELLEKLKFRFDKNSSRFPGINWDKIEQKIKDNPLKLRALFLMEESGGEPNLIAYDPLSDSFTFCDCSAESPKGRRSLCYDDIALNSRKENKPQGSALAMAAQMGAELLTEKVYIELQQLSDFDLKTSSWLFTEEPLRKLGGAIFGDKRYGRTFIYHNGAESYYAARGFRVFLKL
jgi:hypothetical protein